MFFHDRSVVLAIDADRYSATRDATLAPARAPIGSGGPTRLRRAVGRSFLVAGEWLVAEPPRRPARTP